MFGTGQDMTGMGHSSLRTSRQHLLPRPSLPTTHYPPHTPAYPPLPPCFLPHLLPCYLLPSLTPVWYILYKHETVDICRSAFRQGLILFMLLHTHSLTSLTCALSCLRHHRLPNTTPHFPTCSPPPTPPFYPTQFLLPILTLFA